MAERPPRSDDRLELLVGRTLRIGVVTVAAGLALAFVWSAATGSYPPMQPIQSWPGFSPTGLIALSTLALALLPVTRVVLAAVAFGRQRELRYVVFSAVALVFAVLSNVLGALLKRG